MIDATWATVVVVVVDFVIFAVVDIAVGVFVVNVVVHPRNLTLKFG